MAVKPDSSVQDILEPSDSDRKEEDIGGGLEERREAIDDNIEGFFDYVLERVEDDGEVFEEINLETDEVSDAGFSSVEAEIVEEARRYVMPDRFGEAEKGGKRLRPAMYELAALSTFEPTARDKLSAITPFIDSLPSVLSTTSDFDGPEEAFRKNVNLGALTLEFIHYFSLIIDDINDGDWERHEVPTTWVNQKKKAEDLEAEFPMDMGIDQAMQIGHFTRTLADTALEMTNFNSDIKEEMKKTLLETERRMLYGQSRDLWMEELDLGVEPNSRLEKFLGVEYGSRKDVIEDMLDKKTGDLMVASLDMGMISAGLTEQKGYLDSLFGSEDELSTREYVKKYGRQVGVTFQVMDDLLEIEASSSMGRDADDLGKGPTDIINGKTTFVAVSAYENICDALETEAEDTYYTLEELEEYREMLEERYGAGEDLVEEEIEQIADLIYEFQDASEYIEERIETAKNYIDQAELPRGEEKFKEVADYIVKRTR